MPSYTVAVVFTEQEFKDPVSAAKDVADYIRKYSYRVVYDVVDESTGEKFMIDPSKLGEDAILKTKD